MELRDYQREALDYLKESTNSRDCVCLPTGAGKTFLFSAFAVSQKEIGKKTLILVHRKELVQQTFNQLVNHYRTVPFVVTADTTNFKESSVNIAMIETLFRRKIWLEYFRKTVDNLIVDECHIGAFNKILDGFKRIIGFSATPVYVKKGKCLKQYYHNLYVPLQIPDLINKNSLAIPFTYGQQFDRAGFKLNVSRTDYDEGFMGFELSKQYYLEVLLKYVKPQRTIIYNANIAHSQAVTNFLRNNGFNIHHLDGTTPDFLRNSILQKLYNEPDCIVSNVGVLTMGFDCPRVKRIIVNRLTRSRALWIQMCGRGSRLAEDKRTFEIIDMCGNWKIHGLWEDEIDWEYLFSKTTKDKEGEAPVKQCPECETIVHTRIMECFKCGHKFVSKAEVISEDPGLVLIQKYEQTVKGFIHNVGDKGHNPYRSLHLLKEKMFKKYKSKEEVEKNMLLLLPLWEKETGQKNNRYNQKYVKKIIENYV